MGSSERFCCWTCCSEFAYFFFHSSLRTAVLKRRTSKSLSTSLELLLGALAGALAQIFTIPVAVIATRQQLYERDGSKGNTQTRDPSMFDTARDIIEESGVTGLWTGLKPGLVLMVLAAAAVRAAGSNGDDAALTKALNLGPGWSFLLGMTSKTLATVVTYPYIFVSHKAFKKMSPLDA
jgi:adenine nucleotide transporter 17